MACLIISYLDYNLIEQKHQIESSLAIAKVDELFANSGFQNIMPGFIYLNKTDKDIDENKFDLEMALGEVEWLNKSFISVEAFDSVRRSDLTNIIKKISNRFLISKRITHTQDKM